MKKIASLATIPGREEQVERTIESLLPQVDEIFLQLNGHKNKLHLPPNVHQTILDNSLGDGAKFYPLLSLAYSDYFKDFWLICDDDIIYPADYTETMLRGAENHPLCLVSLGGKNMKPNADDWHKHKSLNIHCNNQELLEDVPVQIPLTGVMAGHGHHFESLNEKDFPTPNMADIHLGIWGQKRRKKFFAIARPEKYLTVQQVPSSIFNGGTGTGNESKYIQSINWKHIHGIDR